MAIRATLERWTWCDALFMAPPVWAKIAKITGDKKYNDFMMKEYEATREHLFDEEEHLFYRDNSFIGKRDNDKNKKYIQLLKLAVRHFLLLV